VDKANAEHGAAAFKGGVRKRSAVIHMQLLRQPAALDGGPQHVLARARILVHHPAAMDEESTEVIHK
jgi:hypothetical protein